MAPERCWKSRNCSAARRSLRRYSVLGDGSSSGCRADLSRLRGPHQRTRHREPSDPRSRHRSAASLPVTRRSKGQLASESDQLLAIVVSRNALFASLNGPARQIAAGIATIDNEIAYLQADPHVGGGAHGNHFAYGNCTWYVANRRCIPWLGNAKDLVQGSRGDGIQGGVPAGAQRSGDLLARTRAISSLGHVAYVEAVGPASGVPMGYFKLSEMNHAGFDRVDYRVIADHDSFDHGVHLRPVGLCRSPDDPKRARQRVAIRQAVTSSSTCMPIA